MSTEQESGSSVLMEMHGMMLLGRAVASRDRLEGEDGEAEVGGEEEVGR